MLKKIGHITRGWGKALGFIATTPAETKLSELRLKICKECEHAETKEWVDLLNDSEDDTVSGLVCLLCHCPCIEKSLISDEKCPDKPPRW